MKYQYKIGFIGSGNMAKAIVGGILENRLLGSEQMIMSATCDKESYRGVKIVGDNAQVIDRCEYLFIAVKPQIFQSLQSVLAKTRADHVVSIMAGVNLDRLRRVFPSAELFRVMPNTPCAVGKGMCVMADNGVRTEGEAYVEKILRGMGDVLTLPESAFDAMTSVSGSGPAYVYYFIRSMIRGGTDGGLDYETSKRLTLATFEGAVEMVRRSEAPLDTLIERVCSKGGTTIQAIDTFMQDEVERSIRLGIERCRRRSEELGKA